MNPTEEDILLAISRLVRDAEGLKWELKRGGRARLRPSAVSIVKEAGELASLVGAYQATAKKGDES